MVLINFDRDLLKIIKSNTGKKTQIFPPNREKNHPFPGGINVTELRFLSQGFIATTIKSFIQSIFDPVTKFPCQESKQAVFWARASHL